MNNILYKQLKRKYKNKKILVVYGGWSGERDISIKTGKAIAISLRKSKMLVCEYDFDKNFFNYLKNNTPDIVYIALHGRYGEDGTIQGALDILGIPYTGSGVLGSALAMSKYHSKKVFKASNIDTLPFVMFKTDVIKNDIDKIASNLFYPCVIKANAQGSALGVYIVNNEDECKNALSCVSEHDSNFIIEPYIKGREFTVSVIGNMTLPVIEIIPVNKFYDFEAKYRTGMSNHVVPAKVSKSLEHKMRDLAYNAHKVLECKAVSRVDFLVDSHNNPWVLEVNTIPGMTETSLLPEAAKAVDISFEELVLRIMDYSI